MKTSKNYQFFENGLFLTNCRLNLNEDSEPEQGEKDYRVATMSVQVNGSLWINDIKIFSKENDQGLWYIRLPCSMTLDENTQSEKRYDHVRMTHGQFAILRNYCYDRIDEAVGS